MNRVSTRQVKSILTEQKGGFLVSRPYPFTHSLSPYTGCGFGKTTCGQYCYAQFLPNWTHHSGDADWGEAVSVKDNAAAVLDETLKRMGASKRCTLRILLAPTTDPYQPIDATYQITRQCLEVFARYPDLDLLLMQTRSPLTLRDFDLLQQIPYAWLSVTVETDDQGVITRLGGGPTIKKRLELVHLAAEQGIPAQIAVSPCLPYTPDFAEALLSSGARRFIVDSFVAGDGSRGRRTANSPLAQRAWFDWRDETPALALYETLKARGAEVAWSTVGFCSIPPRYQQPALALEG
jgi:DNA repair photolyase